MPAVPLPRLCQTKWNPTLRNFINRICIYRQWKKGPREHDVSGAASGLKQGSFLRSCNKKFGPTVLLMKHITDTSGDKAEVLWIYILIYAFKHKKTLLGVYRCSVFNTHPSRPPLLFLPALINKQKQARRSFQARRPFGRVKNKKNQTSEELGGRRRRESWRSRGSSFIQTYFLTHLKKFSLLFCRHSVICAPVLFSYQSQPRPFISIPHLLRFFFSFL